MGINRHPVGFADGVIRGNPLTVSSLGTWGPERTSRQSFIRARDMGKQLGPGDALFPFTQPERQSLQLWPAT
jgi:hypothetical protein